MIEHINMFIKITCDKCSKSQSEIDQEEFFKGGWTMKRTAEKYFHLCYSCKTKKEKKSTDWAINKFYYPFQSTFSKKQDISTFNP